MIKDYEEENETYKLHFYGWIEYFSNSLFLYKTHCMEGKRLYEIIIPLTFMFFTFSEQKSQPQLNHCVLNFVQTSPKFFQMNNP